MRRTIVTVAVAVALAGAAAIPAGAGGSPQGVCWTNGSSITTCTYGGTWNAHPSATGFGKCYRTIVLYDTGSGQQSTGWRSAGAAVELGGEFVYVC